MIEGQSKTGQSETAFSKINWSGSLCGGSFSPSRGAEDVKRLKSAGLKYEEAIKIIRMWTHYEGSQ